MRMTQLQNLISENITTHTVYSSMHSIIFYGICHILTYSSNYIFAYYCYTEANLYLTGLGRRE